MGVNLRSIAYSILLSRAILTPLSLQERVLCLAFARYVPPSARCQRCGRADHFTGYSCSFSQCMFPFRTVFVRALDIQLSYSLIRNR